MTCHMNSLHSITELQVHVFVNLPTGATVIVTHTGSLILNNLIVLHKVFYVPSFHCNLLSVSRLLLDNHMQVLFTNKSCLIQSLPQLTVLATGELLQELYYFTLPTPSVSNASTFTVLTAIWHRRLGHTPYDIIEIIPELSKIISKVTFTCTTCPLAKKTHLPFPSSHSSTSHSFSLLHYDFWGPYKVATSTGCKYFLTLVDDYSKALWLFLFSTKQQVSSILHKFLLSVQSQFNTTVKVLRSDNGSEFVNQSLSAVFTKMGIVNQTSCPYTTHQNGVVERKYRTILNMARALRFHGNLPINL